MDGSAAQAFRVASRGVTAHITAIDRLTSTFATGRLSVETVALLIVRISFITVLPSVYFWHVVDHVFLWRRLECFVAAVQDALCIVMSAVVLH